MISWKAIFTKQSLGYLIINSQYYSAQTCILHISHLYLQVQIPVEGKLSLCFPVSVVNWPAVNLNVSSNVRHLDSNTNSY